MVQFEDGSIKAQMGLPDMKLPIQYALGFPLRLPNKLPRYTFNKPDKLSFEEPDIRTFRNLQLAKDALSKGGNAGCVLNAANEIAVYAFLKEPDRLSGYDGSDRKNDTKNPICGTTHAGRLF